MRTKQLLTLKQFATAYEIPVKVLRDGVMKGRLDADSGVVVVSGRCYIDVDRFARHFSRKAA